MNIINPYRFAAVVPTDGLIAEYLFDTDASDTSGNGYNGSLVGSASVASGLLTLDGIDDCVSIADAGDFSFTNGSNDLPCSISMWFKCDLAVGTPQRLITKFNSNSGQREWYMNIAGNGKILMAFQEFNTGDAIYAEGATAYTQNTWHHVVATYDGGEIETGITVYLDNSDDTTTQAELGTYTGMTNTSEVVRIGARGYGTGLRNEFDGQIDNVRIYNRELSAAEVTQLFDEGHD